jgi:hypothetical protein
MKPLLRAVLVINALIFLVFGLLLLLTPWATLYNALQLVAVQPALVGQLFGIALIGLSWLAFHAAIDGALTATAAKVSGHVEWLSGLVLLVWLLGLHTPELPGFGQFVTASAGVILLILGLGTVRLAGAVRRRERAVLAGAASADRAEKRAAQKRGEVRPTPVSPASAAEPVLAPVPSNVAPAGRYRESSAEVPAARGSGFTAFDPATGRAVEPVGERYAGPVPVHEPHAGRVGGNKIDPATGRPIDPVSGRAIDPVTGRTIDPVTGQRDDPGLRPDPVRRDSL